MNPWHVIDCYHFLANFSDTCLEFWISVSPNVLTPCSSSHSSWHFENEGEWFTSLLGRGTHAITCILQVCYALNILRAPDIFYLYVAQHTDYISYGPAYASENNTAPPPFVYSQIQWWPIEHLSRARHMLGTGGSGHNEQNTVPVLKRLELQLVVSPWLQPWHWLPWNGHAPFFSAWANLCSSFLPSNLRLAFFWLSTPVVKETLLFRTL